MARISRYVAGAAVAGAALVGMTLGTGTAEAVPEQGNGWCPGQALPFDNIRWDMNVCHTWYMVPPGTGNVTMVDLNGNPLDSFIYAGDTPPVRNPAGTLGAAAWDTVLQPPRSPDHHPADLRRDRCRLAARIAAELADRIRPVVKLGGGASRECLGVTALSQPASTPGSIAGRRVCSLLFVLWCFRCSRLVTAGNCAPRYGGLRQRAKASETASGAEGRRFKCCRGHGGGSADGLSTDRGHPRSVRTTDRTCRRSGGGKSGCDGRRLPDPGGRFRFRGLDLHARL